MDERPIPQWWCDLPEEVRDDVVVRACYHAFMQYPANFPEYVAAKFMRYALIEVIKDKRVMQVQLNRLVQLQPPAPRVLTASESLSAQEAVMRAEIVELTRQLEESTAALVRGPLRPWWQRPRWLWNLWDPWGVRGPEG